MFHEDKNYALEASKLPLEGSSVLEIGSGTGLMTKELKRLGYKVTTVDPNAPADFKSLNDISDDWYFDNVLALYDVCNYMPANLCCDTCYFLNRLGKNIIIEKWNKEDGVRFFTFKKSGKAKRIRLGIRIKDRAFILFFYWGHGLPALALHKLYL